MKLLHFLLVIALLGAPAAKAQVPGWLEKDFRELTALIEGRWDNERHGFFADDAGLDASILTPRTHYIIRQQETPSERPLRFSIALESGEQVSVEQFAIDADRDAIVQTSFEADGTTRRDCKVLWQRVAGQFQGVSQGPDCVPGDDTNSTVRLAISDTEFWIVARSETNRQEARFRRARSFSCWASILRGAEHGDSGQGSDDWWFQSDIAIHDQGGVAILRTDETPAQKIKLLLRDVEWTYGMNRPSLVLYIHEDAEDARAISYAWAAAGANRIGINLRWLQASCTHKGPK